LGAVVAIDIVVVVAAFAFGTVSVVIPINNCFSKTYLAFKLLLLLLLLWFLALLLLYFLLLLALLVVLFLLIIASQKYILLLSCCCHCCFVAPLVFGAIVAIDVVVVVADFTFGTVSVVIPVDNSFSKKQLLF
jgi:hypothetical protein